MPKAKQARDLIAKELCCYEWSDESAWEYHSEAGKEKWRELADLAIRLVTECKDTERVRPSSGDEVEVNFGVQGWELRAIIAIDHPPPNTTGSNLFEVRSADFVSTCFVGVDSNDWRYFHAQDDTNAEG
ncbi:hypothetical protein LCGC14_0320340 [marine sediment metagenome]|uniref:Uncharacterized protein n=1 Tax=marine sediment metagenome TaxID=412755 RepID=A0A0F9W6X7_9ZZZZ